MNAPLKPQLMKRTIDALKPREKPYIVWDGVLPGFGLRVAPSGHKSFILDYRPHSGGRAVKKRRLTIGAHGPLTAEGARKAAIDALADVRRGADPQQDKVATRTALTVADLIDEFIKGHVEVKAICKASTAAGYKLALERLKKAHGALKARDFTRSQLAAMHAGMSDRPYAANRSLAVISKLYSWGIDHGHLPEAHINPARGVKKNKEEPGDRFLSMGELTRLGDALERAETVGLPRKLDPYAIAAIRLLLLTGARLRKIVAARWGFVDFEKGLLNLPDSKTGKKVIYLNAAALEVLASIPRVSGNPHIIAGANDGAPRADLKKPWAALTKAAGLEGLRIHDLRHSHASVAAAGGHSLQMIGKLLGHSNQTTTARYAHLADSPIRQASEATGAAIDAAMRRKTPGAVIPLRAVQK